MVRSDATNYGGRGDRRSSAETDLSVGEDSILPHLRDNAFNVDPRLPTKSFLFNSLLLWEKVARLAVTDEEFFK